MVVRQVKKIYGPSLIAYLEAGNPVYAMFFEEFQKFVLNKKEIGLEDVHHLSPNLIMNAVEAMDHECGFDNLDQQWIYFTDPNFSTALLVTLEKEDDSGIYPKPVETLPSCTYNFTYTPEVIEEVQGAFFYPKIYPIMTARNGEVLDTGIPRDMIFPSVEAALKHYQKSAERLHKHPWQGLVDMNRIEKYLK